MWDRSSGHYARVMMICQLLCGRPLHHSPRPLAPTTRLRYVRFRGLTVTVFRVCSSMLDRVSQFIEQGAITSVKKF